MTGSTEAPEASTPLEDSKRVTALRGDKSGFVVLVELGRERPLH